VGVTTTVRVVETGTIERSKGKAECVLDLRTKA
jgi:phenylacetate-coenzyme A ligase PaaK-like adenylate-forming protein